jgi:hypothetical protein
VRRRGLPGHGSSTGPIRIIKEEQRGPAKVSGTLMSVCDDHALLLKDLVPARNQALRELNDPILHLQLVMRLLARALPQGPLAIGASHSVNLSEPNTPVRVRKGPSAARDFGAPWQARGAVTRSAAGDIAFDLAFTYTDSEAGGARQEMKISGVWRQSSDLQKAPDSFALADWSVYRVDLFSKTLAGKVEFNAVAAVIPLPFKTMGELRARIEREWEENPRALKIMECR